MSLGAEVAQRRKARVQRPGVWGAWVQGLGPCGEPPMTCVLPSPTVDDEEEMLYGDSGSLFSPSKEEARRSSQPPADRDPTPFRAEPTHWCLLVRENGTMEVGGALCPHSCPLSAPASANHHTPHRFTSSLTGGWCSW